MTLLSGIGTVLILVLGCLLLALIAELYYLLWWTKQRISSSNSNSNSNIEKDYSNHTNEIFYLFCWDKPNSIQTHPVSNPPTPNRVEQDLEMGLGLESVESEIMRLYNLSGPPRFLFTIKEETKEDLESDDLLLSRKASRTRSRSFSDLILAIDSKSPFLSPMPSPIMNSGSANMNHHMKPSLENDELFRLRASASPPPKFKFLRDAEEKLYRRLYEEAQKNGNLEEGTLINSQSVHVSTEEEGKDGNLVLPLVSSPPNRLH